LELHNSSHPVFQLQELDAIDIVVKRMFGRDGSTESLKNERKNRNARINISKTGSFARDK
jgi:hypothetical protein